MSSIPTNIHIDNDTELTFTTQKRSPWLMRFRAFGALNYKEPYSLSAVDYISEFSKPELFLFREVCKHTENHCRLTLRPRLYSTADKAKLKTAIRLWIKKKLLVRTKREHYMVNPFFLIPSKAEQRTAIQDWKTLNKI